MDTPFWEQLQYIDDTRVQSLISYTVPSDDRLARQALHAFDESRVPEGYYAKPLSRLACNSSFLIFSLSYIDMLHDYWMYRPDSSHRCRTASEGQGQSWSGSSRNSSTMDS